MGVTLRSPPLELFTLCQVGLRRREQNAAAGEITISNAAFITLSVKEPLTSSFQSKGGASNQRRAGAWASVRTRPPLPFQSCCCRSSGHLSADDTSSIKPNLYHKEPG